MYSNTTDIHSTYSTVPVVHVSNRHLSRWVYQLHGRLSKLTKMTESLTVALSAAIRTIHRTLGPCLRVGEYS